MGIYSFSSRPNQPPTIQTITPITLVVPTSETGPSSTLKPFIPVNPSQPLAIMHPNSLELEATLTPLPPSSSDIVGVAINDESNVFGDILDTIDKEDWLDGLVDQAMRKTSMRGLVPTASGLKEHHLSSSHFDDKPIGTIVAAGEKKAIEKGRKRPSAAEEEEAEEDVPGRMRKQRMRGHLRHSLSPRHL